MFLNWLGAAKGVLIRAAASTQPLGIFLKNRMNLVIRHFSFITSAFLITMCFSGCVTQTQNTTNSIQTEVVKPSPSPIVSQSPDNPNLTVAGKSVGLLKLGDSRERVLELFPKKPNYDEEYTYDKKCCGCSFTFSEIHWLPPKFENNGLFIYFREGRVFQIMVETDRFPTAEKIKPDSAPREVRQHYPNLNKAFVLLGSGADVVGGRELIYWVAIDSGIAFEFYYNRRKNQRLVKSVIVFEPNSEFQPNGCVSNPQELKEIEPYSLEAPEKMLRDFEKKSAS